MTAGKMKGVTGSMGLEDVGKSWLDGWFVTDYGRKISHWLIAGELAKS